MNTIMANAAIVADSAVVNTVIAADSAAANTAIVVDRAVSSNVTANNTMANVARAVKIYSEDSNRKASDNKWDIRVRQSKERRRAELKRHIFQLFFAVCFICAVILGANNLISRAGEAKEAELSFKYYRNIPVEQGDTLSSIAQTYADQEHYETTDDYVQEVRLINHLEEEDKIYTGDYLIIPYYSNELK